MTSVGDFTFPERRTVVTVRTREVLSRVRREIEIVSLFCSYASLSQLESDLEALEGALERFDRREAGLSLHPGRYLMGWRRDWQKLIEPQARAASIRLLALTDDRFERSVEEHVLNVSITQQNQATPVSQAGNGLAFPRFLLTATGTLINPSFSDGSRTLTCNVQLSPGETLEIDSDRRSVLKNGTTNVLSQTSGEFPLLEPGGGELVYADDAASSHLGSLEIRYRDLWV